MGELVKSLRHFIARDAIYLLGGGVVLLSALYLFDHLPPTEPPLVYVLAAAGLAYVTGYAVQDLFCMTPFSTLSICFAPGPIRQWFYYRFTKEKWKNIDHTVPYSEMMVLIDNETFSEKSAAQLERLVSLRQISTTMSPCLIIAAVFLLFRALSTHSRFDIVIASSSILLGLGLIPLGWVKGMQEMLFNSAMSKYLVEKRAVVQPNAALQPTGAANLAPSSVTSE